MGVRKPATVLSSSLNNSFPIQSTQCPRYVLASPTTPVRTKSNFCFSYSSPLFRVTPKYVPRKASVCPVMSLLPRYALCSGPQLCKQQLTSRRERKRRRRRRKTRRRKRRPPATKKQPTRKRTKVKVMRRNQQKTRKRKRKRKRRNRKQRKKRYCQYITNLT